MWRHCLSSWKDILEGETSFMEIPKKKKKVIRRKRNKEEDRTTEQQSFRISDSFEWTNL